MYNNMLFKYSKLLIILAMLMFAFTFSGCNREDDIVAPVVEEDPLIPAQNISTNLTGVVLDEEGKPLQGVKVSAYGSSATTSADGSFRFQNISVPENRCVISCEKEGFFTSVRAEVPEKNAETTIRIRLMSNEPTHTIVGSTGGSAVLDNGSSVEIPANGLVTESGETYGGEVNMSVRYQDPSAISFGAFVAGGDMLARRTDESSSILYSYGILRVELTGSAGEKLQLAAGKPSTITVAIPPSQLSTAPQTIPLWYFDEVAGIWQEEGSATRQGDKYVGTVNHFTDWNCDDPNEFATVIGRVVDCNGGLIMHGEVFVGQSTKDLNNGVIIDNGPGGGNQSSFSMRVPAGIPTMVVVPPPLIPVLSSTEGTDWVLVPVPPLSPGQVYDVGDIKPHPCPSLASGKLKLKQGDELADLNIHVLEGGSNSLYQGVIPASVEGTSFSSNILAANTTYMLNVTTKSGLAVSKEFQTKSAGESVDLGTIDLTALEVIPVEGLVLCQDTPIENAVVEVAWEGGSVNLLTDNLGLYSFSMPKNLNATVSVTHSRGTGTITFNSSNGEGYRINTINICTVDSETGENSFVINGAGYNETLKNINVSPFPLSFAYYDKDSNSTLLSATDVSGNLQVTLNFPGNTVGKAATGGETGAWIRINNGNTDVNYWAGFELPESSIDINVTQYDAVEGLIEGTFSGTFIGEDESVITIKEGKFSIIRYYDYGAECGGYCM